MFAHGVVLACSLMLWRAEAACVIPLCGRLKTLTAMIDGLGALVPVLLGCRMVQRIIVPL